MIDWETYNYNEKENIGREGEESATAAYKHGHISALRQKKTMDVSLGEGIYRNKTE